jgi:hypothetical protein
MHSRQEILKTNFEDYQRASKKGRKELLDRLVPVTGLNRSYLATALSNYGKQGKLEKSVKKGKRQTRLAGKRGGRPVKYGESFVKVLIILWNDFDKPCGKLLAPMIRNIIDFLIESKKPDYRIQLTCTADCAVPWKFFIYVVFKK